MAKIEDMSAKNQNKLRASEKGEKIDWAELYAGNLETWAVAMVAKGGITILHTHLRALAQVAFDDEQGTQKEKRIKLINDRGGSFKETRKSLVELSFAKGKDHVGRQHTATTSPMEPLGNLPTKKPLSFSPIGMEEEQADEIKT